MKMTQLLGFNLLNYNVITMSLARTYRGEYRLRPSRLGAIPPSPVGLKIGVQYGPPAYGRRSVLHPNFAASGDRDGIAPNLSDSDGIPRYVLARLMVFYQCKTPNTHLRS